VTLRDSSVVILVNASLCVNVVMVNVTAWTAVTSSTAVCYTQSLKCINHFDSVLPLISCSSMMIVFFNRSY